jgi:hypothetical protein
MNKLVAAAVAALLLAAVPLSLSYAEPKQGSGSGCVSERKTGTDDKGNKLDCEWDKCPTGQTKCVTIANQLRCGPEYSFSNPRDCKPVAKIFQPQGTTIFQQSRPLLKTQ